MSKTDFVQETAVFHVKDAQMRALATVTKRTET